jgi:hypothetical protein
VAARRPELASKWQGARLRISDVPPGHLAYPAVSAAVASGVLSLDVDGTFNPLRPVSGAEATAAVTRLEAMLRPASPEPVAEGGSALPKPIGEGRS